MMNDLEVKIQPRTSKKIDTHTFNPGWKEMPDFKDWIEKVDDDRYSYRCNLCNATMSCRSGISNPRRHSRTEGHMKKCLEKGIEVTSENDASFADDGTVSFEQRKKIAELKVATFCVVNNISYRVCEKMVKFHQELAKDPEVFQSIKMSKSKCSKLVGNVLGPGEMNRLARILRNTPFSIHVDESTDVGTGKKFLAFSVRYVDPETDEVVAALMELIDLGAIDCNAEHIFNCFQKTMNKHTLPFCNIIAIASDNASVMLGNTNSFKSRFSKLNQFASVFGCPCHLSALIAQDACKSLPGDIEPFIRDLVNFIRRSAQKSGRYGMLQNELEGTELRVLKYCVTRWLSRHQCISRLIQLWPTLSLFIQELHVDNLKDEKVAKFYNAMREPETLAYLYFLEYVLDFFNEFNAFFQAHETRIHLRRSKALNFLTSISKHFLKPAINAYAASCPHHIKFDDPCNQKVLTAVDLGAKCNDVLGEMPTDTAENLERVNVIRRHCLAFYVQTVNGILSRFTDNDDLLMSLESFKIDTAIFGKDRDLTFHDVLFTAKKFCREVDEQRLRKEWRVLPESCKSVSSQIRDASNFDDAWKIVFNIQGDNDDIKFPTLRSIVNIVRSLPNSNAEAERVFSTVTDTVTKKRGHLSAVSISAQSVTKFGLKSRKETPQSMEIGVDHLALVVSEQVYKPFAPKKQKLINLPAADEFEFESE